MQHTISAFLAGLCVGMLCYGPLSDRYGRRPLLLGSLVLYAAATLGCLYAASVELPAGHHLLGAAVSMEQLALEPFVLYPGNIRPSYADHVLQLFARHDLKVRVAQMTNELQTAIGLVAAGIGITLVPASVQRLHRDDIGYSPLLDPLATSPIIVSYRAGDESALLQQCLTWIAELAASASLAADVQADASLRNRPAAHQTSDL